MYVGSIGPIIPVQSLCWPWMTNPMVKGKLFSVYAFAIKLRNSASSFHWLSSSIFNVCLFVCCPASVTPPLISTIWCFRPYKPYIFCEDMILATCQCQHILCIHYWVEPSLLLSSFNFFLSFITRLNKCPIDAHWHRHRRKNTRITKNFKEFPWKATNSNFSSMLFIRNSLESN